MPYPYESYPVTGAAIRSAAEDTSGRVSSVRSVVGQVQSEHRNALSAVEGQLEGSVADAPSSTVDHATEIEQTAIYASGCLEFFAHGVDIFNTDGISPRSVSKLNSDWEALVASSFGVVHDTLPPTATQEDRTNAQTSFDNAVSSARSTKQHEFDLEFGRLDHNLDTCATEVQGKLGRGPNDRDIKDLYSAGALPIYAALIWPNIDFSHQYLPPEKAQQLARAIAEQVNSGEIDADTVRLMSLYKDNANFSAEFYRNSTPDQIATAIEGLSDDAFPESGLPNVDQEAAKLYHDFLVAAGGMLATYSKGVGENAPPSDLAQQWSDAICSEDEDDKRNASALSLLFKYGQDGKFDEDFLADVTSDVYEYEISKGGDPVWSPRGGWNEAGGFDGALDLTYEDGMWMHSHGYDPLANLMTAMNESPGAAEQFFGEGGTTEYDDTGAQVNERLLYLLRDRIWPTDDGDGLGQALEGATTGTRDGSTQGMEDAALASQLVHLIANETGDGDDWHDDGWRIPEGMRDSVGNVVASYVSDVYRIAQNDSGDPSSLNDWVYGDDASEDAYNDIFGLRASNGDLSTVLQEIGRGDDKSGIEAVTTAALLHNNNLTQEYLETYNSEHPDAPKTIDDLRSSGILDDLQDQSSRTGKTLDFIVQNGMDGGTDGEGDENARREMFAKAFSVATSFIPGPEGKILGPLTSEGLSLLNDQLGEVPESVTEQWANDTDGAIKHNLEYDTYNALVNQGYLDHDVDPRYGIPDGAVIYRNGEYQIDPELYDTDPANAPVDVQNAFNTWQNGTDPGDPSSHQNGAPSQVFQQYLNDLAGYVAKHT